MTAYVVTSGQTSSGLTLNSGDTETVSSGGAADNDAINRGGLLTVSAGGAAKFDMINSGGSETVSSGGTAWGTKINSGGLVTVSSGATTEYAMISGGGSETVSSGATATSTTIAGSGVLDLLSGAVVSGGITLSGTGGELQIGGTAMPSSTISGFVSGDTFDLTSIPFDSAGSATLAANNQLQITEGGTTYDLNLDPGQFFTGDYFHLASDGNSGTLVTENATPPSPTSPAASPPSPPSPPPPPVVLNDFSWAQGWGSAADPRIVTDVNGDGNSDYVGFGYSATFIAYGGTFSNGQGSDGPGFSGVTEAVQDFGTSEGYTADDQRGAAAAGVGDGDILYGQGDAGIYWYEATGETAQTDAAGNTYDVLQYQTSPNFYGNFGSNEGWTPDNGFQILKTDSTDSSASILGFGDDGIVVGPDAFASGATAADSYVIPLAVGNNSGWNQSVDIRTFTDQNGKPIDLNGDGIADFVGMGPNGLVYAYGSDSGPGGSYTLGPLQTAQIDGTNDDLGEAQGWTDATTVRDVVYDANTGYDDIIAFGAAGVYVSMGQDPATHNGQPFGQLYLALADFGSDQGWSVSQTPRLVGDVTGDGIPDIVGFGENSTYVAVGSYDSSGNLQFTIDPARTIADYGSADGWSGSAEQTVRALGTVAATGSTGSHSDLILSGADNTQIVPLTDSSSAGSDTTSGNAGVTPSTSSGGSTAPSPSAAAPAFTATGIDPTVAIAGSPVEGTTLTASAVVTGGFTGTTQFHWQRFYAGSWWNIPLELSPYTAGEILTYAASPTYVVREEDEDVSAIRVEADFVDNTGVTVAVVDSPSIGPVLDEPASLSLSPITGSAVAGATLSVSGQVVTDEGTFTPLIEWQRFYSGGWWDIPVELSPYSSGEVFTYVTTPTYVVRPEDANVLAIRAEAIYVDDTGQTFTAFSDLGTGGAELTIVEPPLLTAADATLGEDAASVALAITVAPHDTDYTLGGVTIGGVPSDWSLSGDGAASIAPGVWTAGSGGLGALLLVAPSSLEEDTFTLSVTASESAVGPTGILTATATTSFAVSVTPVAGAPVLTASGVTVAESNAASTIALTIGDTQLYGDNTLGEVTIGGVPSGWSLNQGITSGNESTWIETPAQLSGLRLVSPASGDEPTSFTLGVTATATEPEVSGPATATAALVVTVIAAAEPPVFSGSTTFSGGASVTLSGLSVAASDPDDALSATVTGLSSGWTLVDTSSNSSFTGCSITAIPVSDLGSLVVVASAGTTSGSDVLILTVSSSLGASTTSGSEALTLVAQSYTSLSGDLSGANLTGADLTGANLAGVNLTGAMLTDATLTGADLFFANLSGATLTGANLAGANLFLAGVGAADLSGADLSGAFLVAANLSSANLTGADLDGAALDGANLTDTTLPLQLSSLGASASGHDVTGGVVDGFTGAVTIAAVDNTTTLATITIGYSPADQAETWSISNVPVAQGDTITVTAMDSEGAFYSVSGTVAAAAPAGVAGNPINLALTDPSGGGPIAVTIAGIPEGWSLSAGSELANGAWTVETGDPSALAITPADFVGAAALSVSESWLNADGSSASAFVTDNVEAYAPGNPLFALSGDDTLTGSGANDLFVFAQPIGNDQIYDFQPASSQIDLIGFPGISSFADLQGKMANDSSGNVALTLGSGETITIVGVDAASLGAGNFLFNAEPVTSNAGDMTIADGATLPLGGIVDNSGTIALSSVDDETDLVVLSGGLTLQGGGAVTLSDNAGNAIVGSGADTTLTNLDNIINGAGTLGDDTMTLNNSGVIDATGVNPLIIDTGSNSIANSGTIEATGAGGLVIKGAVANSGTLSADGGNLTVDGAVTGAGIAVIAGTATLEFGAASAESTSFAPGAAGTLRLDQSAGFTGVVSGFAAGDAIDLTDLAFASNMALGYTDNGAGGGVVTVGNAVQVVDLALLGQYAAAGFKAQSDPGGGTLITYTLQTSASDPTSLTNPSHQP